MIGLRRSHVALGLIGASVILVALTLTRAAMPIRSWEDPFDPYSSETVRSNLQTIASALYTYAAENQDYLPPRLSTLYPAYVSDPAVFWNPGDTDPCPTTIDNDEPNQPNSAQVSFVFLGAGKRLREAPFILVQDNATRNNWGGGVHAAISDGRVEFFMFSMAPLPITQTALENLMQITMALGTYAEANEYRLPPTLSALYPAYISDPAVFWNPGDNLPGDPPAPTTIDNDVPDAPNSAQISYTYLGANKTISEEDLVGIVLQDNSPCNNGGAVINMLDMYAGILSCVQIPSCADAASCRAVAQHKLDLIGKALYGYATENQEVFPKNLSMLYRDSIFDPTVFWNPGDSDPCPLIINNDAPNQPDSTQTSFAYFGGHADVFQTAVVAQDNSLANNDGMGVHVLTADASAEFFERCDRWLPHTETARSNLRLIDQALHAYAAAHNDQYPDKLSQLYPTYIGTPAVFWNPGDHDPQPTTINNDVQNGADSAQVSYHYLGAGYTTACNPGVILVEDNDLLNNGGTGINILTADGVADYFAPAPQSCQYGFSCTSIASSRLRGIGLALATYASDNQDRLPARLSMLSGIARPTNWWHPGDSDPYPLTIDNDELNQPNSTQISFEFVAAGQNLGQLPPDAILAQDNTPANNGGNGILVLYADIHVEYVPIRSVASIAVSGPDTVPEGGSATYTCTATYDDGTTQDVTAGSLWRLPDILPDTFSEPGTFTAPGMYTAPDTVLADTPVTVHVIYTDEGGVKQETDMTVTVQNTVRVLRYLSITSGPDTVPEGGTADYTCTAIYDDESTQDVTASAAWSMYWGPGSFTTPGRYAAPGTVWSNTSAAIWVEYTEGGMTRVTTKAITVLNSIRILDSVSISSEPSTVPEGGTANYTCTATYDDGSTQDVTAAATWSVDSGPGSFPSPGIYTAPSTVLSDELVEIRVSYTEEGVTKEKGMLITVLNSVRVLSSLSISSGPDTVPEGGKAYYACTATYDDESTKIVTMFATWSVSDGPGSFTSPGTYAAPAAVVANTPATIHVSYTEEGVTEEAEKAITILDVYDRILSSVAISSEPSTIPEGGTANYLCTATYDDGTTQEVTTSASWYVVTGPGSFSSPGTYVAPAAVAANTFVSIRAIYVEGGRTKLAYKDITIQNTDRLLEQVSISGPETVERSSTADYTCTATYDDGSTQNVTASGTWSVPSGPGSISTVGVYTAPTSLTADTPATIHVSYTEGGITKQAEKSITVQNIPRLLSSIAISSGPNKLSEGGTADYTCTATYDDNSTENVTVAGTWSVTSGPGSFSSAGTYVAPASVTANTSVTISVSYAEGGITKEVDKKITVENTVRVLSSVAISAGPSSLSEGSTAKYTCTATYDDKSTKNVTSDGTWSVPSGLGSFSSPGTYAAPASVEADTAVIIHVSYTEADVTSEADKTITVIKPGPTLTGVSISSGPATVPQGGSATYACTATYEDTTTADVTALAVWSVASGPGSFPTPGTYAAPATVTADTTVTLKAAYAIGGVTKEATKDIVVQEASTQTFTVRVVTFDGSSVPYTYDAGTWAEITAPTAPEGMRFSHWSGDLTGSDNPAQVYVDSDKTITANFETCPIQRTLPCGAGTPVCAMATMLALGLFRLRSRRGF